MDTMVAILPTVGIMSPAIISRTFTGTIFTELTAKVITRDFMVGMKRRMVAGAVTKVVAVTTAATTRSRICSEAGLFEARLLFPAGFVRLA